MHFLPTLLALSSLSLPFQSAQRGQATEQEKPGSEKEVPRDLFGREASTKEAHYEELQGAWQLVGLSDPLLDTDGRSEHGLMIVHDQFLAIELHVAWDDAEGFAIEDAFQTGVHEFAMDRSGTIQMVSMIGSFLDEFEQLDWEEPGTVREFRVSHDGAFLTLRRLDGSALKFVRRKPRVGTSKDMFGRTQDELPVARRDVFGRPVPRPVEPLPEGEEAENEETGEEADPEGEDQTATDDEAAAEGEARLRNLFGRPERSDEVHYEAVQGAWQLVSLNDPFLSNTGRSLHGMLLVSGQFMALEMHVAWDEEDGTPLEDAFQTGFYEFDVDSTGALQSISLIGSFLDEDEELEWESPGVVRMFRISTDGSFLTLSRQDGSSMKFIRRRPRVGRRDVFGRTEGGAVLGERDVYGRKIQPKEAPVDDTEGEGDRKEPEGTGGG